MYLPALLWLFLVPIAAVLGAVWLRYDSIGRVTRMKMTFLLVSASFAASCVGMWQMMRLLQMLLVAHYPKGAALGDFHLFCLNHYGWLPFMSIPAVGYALWVAFRGLASVERFCVFTSVLAFVFIDLLFTVIVAGMSSGIPLYDAVVK